MWMGFICAHPGGYIAHWPAHAEQQPAWVGGVIQRLFGGINTDKLVPACRRIVVGVAASRLMRPGCAGIPA